MQSPNSLIANVDNATAVAHYYPATTGDVGIAMDRHVVATLGFVVSGGVTVTVEACMRRRNQSADSQLSDVWVDITKMFTDMNTGIASTGTWVDTSGIAQANGLDVERIRIKADCSDATNSIDVWLRRM